MPKFTQIEAETLIDIIEGAQGHVGPSTRPILKRILAKLEASEKTRADKAAKEAKSYVSVPRRHL